MSDTKFQFHVGALVWHGSRYWKTNGITEGEVLGWDTRYIAFTIQKITAKQITVLNSGVRIVLSRGKMEREGKQYHTRFHEYFYAEKPKPGSPNWNWAGSDPDFKPPTFGSTADPSAARLLGVSPPFTIMEVKRAYKRLAKRMHPDGGGSHAEFISLKDAYDSAMRSAT